MRIHVFNYVRLLSLTFSRYDFCNFYLKFLALVSADRRIDISILQKLTSKEEGTSGLGALLVLITLAEA